MAEEKREEKRENGNQAKEGFLKSIISGSLLGERIILGNLGFIALLTILGAIYIASRFHAEKITRETDMLHEEVRELRAEAMATSAELMSLSKQSEVVRLVRERGLGLSEIKEPPYKLIVRE
jgi:cell division protein FtsL